MKKIDLGQAISILANIGVIAGIVFLVVEIQQNTAAIRSQSSIAINDSLAHPNQALYDNPDLTGKSSEQDLPRIFGSLSIAGFCRNSCWLTGTGRNGHYGRTDLSTIFGLTEEFNPPIFKRSDSRYQWE